MTIEEWIDEEVEAQWLYYNENYETELYSRECIRERILEEYEQSMMDCD